MRRNIEPGCSAASAVFFVLLMVAASPGPAGAVDPPQSSDLSGVYTSNEGTLYYVRQLGSVLWWAGFNPDPFSPVPVLANSFHRGILSAQVFRGTISGATITGDWAEVPRQATSTLRNGNLQLLVQGSTQLHVQSQTGGLQLTDLTRITLPTLLCTDSAGHRDPACLFAKVLKNQQPFLRGHESLLDNLKPYKDNAVVFGTAATPLQLISPFGKTTTCQDFFNKNDDDGDLTIDVYIDRANLDSQPGFWTDGWINSPGHVLGKMAFLENRMHTESIMFGRADADCTAGEPILLPGWGERNAAGTLFQGIPIAGDVAPLGSFLAIGGQPVHPGDRVRITGPLALDCGHGATNPCYETENDPNNNDTKNLEIHPIYSIDVVQDFSLPRLQTDLTGNWAASDVGTYYVRQIGNTVWWLGLSSDGGIAFANVFKGAVQAATHTIQGEWAAVPLSHSQNNGTLTVSGLFCPALSNDQLPCSSTAPAAQWNLLQTQQTSDPAFGKLPLDGFQWRKLYDRNRPKLQLVVPQSVSLGTISNGGEGSGNLVLTNVGASPVHVQNILSSVAAIDRSPQTLTVAPSSSATVHVSWLIATDTSPGKHPHTATLRVLSDDPVSPSVAVNVQMTVNGGKPQ
ncbi:MAG TPA: hypothetical protein VMH81_25915 [Bryobacteraceae bacterium]|nr:hypothetical protein [Bryobacteraceae bacterium]